MLRHIDSNHCQVYSNPMTLADHRDRSFTLAGLAGTASDLLERAGVRAEDGRVGATLDERTLRYYQTLGLLDRPGRYEGRQAIYGYRQLLQALSVRLLQAQGHSLAQIQGALAGVGTSALEEALTTTLPGAETPMQRPPSAPAPRPLLAAEVAPGVTVLLDPRHAERAEAIFAAISALFPLGGPS